MQEIPFCTTHVSSLLGPVCLPVSVFFKSASSMIFKLSGCVWTARLFSLERRTNPHFNEDLFSGQFHRPQTKESWSLFYPLFSLMSRKVDAPPPENPLQAALCLSNNTRDVTEDAAGRALLWFWLIHLLLFVCSHSRGSCFRVDCFVEEEILDLD